MDKWKNDYIKERLDRLKNLYTEAENESKENFKEKNKDFMLGYISSSIENISNELKSVLGVDK